MDGMLAKMLGRFIVQMLTEQFADSMKTKSERTALLDGIIQQATVESERTALLDGIIQQATVEKERLGTEEPEPEDYDKVLGAIEKLIN